MIEDVIIIFFIIVLVFVFVDGSFKSFQPGGQSVINDDINPLTVLPKPANRHRHHHHQCIAIIIIIIMNPLPVLPLNAKTLIAFQIEISNGHGFIFIRPALSVFIIHNHFTESGRCRRTSR